jgi:archaellum biogenesis ATPase FlaH
MALLAFASAAGSFSSELRSTTATRFSCRPDDSCITASPVLRDRELSRSARSQKSTGRPERDPSERIFTGVTDKAQPDHWLTGTPMDPCAVPAEPLPGLPGFPFVYAGSCAVIVGPTGGGRSSLAQAGLYDAALAGERCAYLGCEVTSEEFNARAAILTQRRGDTIDEKARERLALVRYLDLASVVVKAWNASDSRFGDGVAGWVREIVARYRLIVIDPLSAVASALDFDFDKSNHEFVRFYDRIVQPLTAGGVSVILIDNIGHDPDAKSRAKGASAKQDRADLTFSCSLSTTPPGLTIRAGKVRSVRAGFERGDEWLFTKDTQRIVRRERSGADQTSTFRPTGQMQRVSEAIERDAGLSKRAVRTAVGGKAAVVDLALELLIAEGYIATEEDGQALRHHSVKPYREPTVSTVSAPCPNRVPDTPPSDRVPVSSHLSEGHGHGHGHEESDDSEPCPEWAEAVRAEHEEDLR